MHLHHALLLTFTVFMTLALAIPTQPIPRSNIQKRSFKVHLKRNTAFKGYHGPTQLYKTYAKYGIPIPEGLHRAAHLKNSTSNGIIRASDNSTGVGIVSATPVEPNDLEYIAPITVGGQTLDMNFDTGSSDLWLFNTQLSPETRAGHTAFDPSQSPTFSFLPGHTFSITYGDGSGAKGNVGIDTVDIGGVSVQNQAIELATSVSASFVRDTNSNGLVGLGFSKINSVKPVKQKTFFDNVIADLAEPVFTADLRQDEVGAYEFGRIDAARFKGALSWAAIDASRGFWEFATTEFRVGSGSGGGGNASTGRTVQTPGHTAIADTGTTLMLVSPRMVNEYYAAVPGAVNNLTVGGITFPCDAVLPDLHVDVGGGYMARVEGRFINFAVVDEGGARCFGGLQPTPIEGGLQIWGDVFFKGQFVAFQGGNHSLGLAEHA